MLWEPPRSDRYFYILVQKSIFSSQISFLDTFNLRTKNVLDFEFSRQKADPILNLSSEYLCQKNYQDVIWNVVIMYLNCRDKIIFHVVRETTKFTQN